MTSYPNRCSILYDLFNEEEIIRYLEAAKMDVDEEECDSLFFFTALADIAKARLINQLAKDTGIERKTLCNLFLEGTDEIQDPKTVQFATEAIFKTFCPPFSSMPKNAIPQMSELAHAT
jgi:DNA-binding phage protein